MRRFFLPILIGGMAILMLLTGCNSFSEKEQVDHTLEKVKVVYYADFDEYSKTTTSTVTIDDVEVLQDLFDLIVSCRDNA